LRGTGVIGHRCLTNDAGGEATMESLENQARSAVAALGKRGKTSRVPTGVREIVLDYTREQRAKGVSWREIATAVGLSSTVIKRWAGIEKRSSKKIVPVAVRSGHSVNGNHALALVMPTGIRLEGLTVGEAAEILKTLV
jgi:hypothetical protein